MRWAGPASAQRRERMRCRSRWTPGLGVLRRKGLPPPGLGWEPGCCGTAAGNDGQGSQPQHDREQELKQGARVARQGHLTKPPVGQICGKDTRFSVEAQAGQRAVAPGKRVINLELYWYPSRWRCAHICRGFLRLALGIPRNRCRSQPSLSGCRRPPTQPNSPLGRRKLWKYRTKADI